MKKSGQCPKCDGTRIVRLDYLLDSADWTGSGGGGPTDRSGSQHVVRQLAVAETTKTKPGLFGGTSTHTVKRPVTTEAYICADCGLVEEYVLRPDEVVWDNVQGARWHKPIVR
jgi:hypothetical protein